MAGNKSNRKTQSDESPPKPPASLGLSKLQDIADLALLARPSRHVKRARVRRRDPNRVPRPMNCFLVYRCEKQKEITAFCPGANHRDISKVVAKWWREAPASEKELYRNLAKEAKKQHTEQYPQYKYAPRPRRQKQMEELGSQKENDHCRDIGDEYLYKFSHSLTDISLQDSMCCMYWPPTDSISVPSQQDLMYSGPLGVNAHSSILYYPAFPISKPLSPVYPSSCSFGINEDTPHMSTLGYSPSSSPDWESIKNEVENGMNRSLYGQSTPFYMGENILYESPKDENCILNQTVCDEGYLSCSFLSSMPSCMYSL
ncbi:hypothetical protein CLU79DRAFT_736821 [Phycomyces nitens]|nr:hypothetical protein CLU79DRAFT_736821 [Phycomyces nitens]